MVEINSALVLLLFPSYLGKENPGKIFARQVPAKPKAASCEAKVSPGLRVGRAVRDDRSHRHGTVNAIYNAVY